MPFSSAHPALGRALAARDYTTATAVQTAVLGAAVGRDLLVSAQTGSGKTVAFGMAIAATLLGTAERFEAAAAPSALIIAPTRELAMQVQRELAWLYAETGARIVTCVGGMDPRAEARQLGLGAHIVVGTPGRLRDQMERKRLDLSRLESIVLDEADEMLDLGFREDLEFLLDATPAERQTLMFSATLPREIETLATRYQRDALRIATTLRDAQHADIEYQAIRVASNDVENAVVNLLRFHEMRAALVFCATREAVKRMSARLLERGFSAVALSGELTQAERTHALQAVRDGRARVLVATDVAARGLDLPDLALVIHADLPRDPETLLHRSGRTGRAGRKGLCALIVPYQFNRRVNQLIGATRVKVTWGNAPTAEQIRVRDQERFLADPIFSETPSDEDSALARALQAGRTADEIALALVRVHKARLPAPEDVAEDTGPARRALNPRDRPRTGKKQFERKTDYARAPEGAGHGAPRGDRPPRPSHQRLDEGREMVWFRLNIGRERDADPRWLLPLICKAGGITKAEIGSIKIHDRDTRFQVLASHADAFADAVRLNKNKEGHIARVSVHTSADDAAVGQALRSIAVPGGGEAKVDAGPIAESAAPAAAPSKSWTKKPWAEKSRADTSGTSQHKSETGAGSSTPWVKKPWAGKGGTGRGKLADGGNDRPAERRTFAAKEAVGSRPYLGKKPHRKGQGASASAGAPSPRAEARPEPRVETRDGKPLMPGATKASSKYAQKKKNRPPIAAAK